MLSLDCRGSEGTSHKSAGSTKCRYARRSFTDGHLMNAMERPPPCGCTTRECDGLACGSVVGTTAQDRNITNHHIVEQVPGDCITMQETPKAHHSNKLIGPGHGYILSGQLRDDNQLIINDGQYGD